MAQIQLGNKIINADKSHVYIIAEIGQNHQGDLNIAKQMILQAKQAGCDCVKFQKSELNSKFTKAALERAYAGDNSWGKTYGSHKQHLEFSRQQYKMLQSYSEHLNIDFTASAMDEISLDFLDLLNPPFIKIGSGDANNLPLLQKCAQLKRPLIISTGMQSLNSIDSIVNTMQKANKTNFALLHCVSAYPTQAEDCSLQLIPYYRQRYPNLVIGYSGHEVGLTISAAAILAGARILERHFTLDKNQKGSDHCCSLEPLEMQQLVSLIRQLQTEAHLEYANYSLLEIQNILKANAFELDVLAQALKPTSVKALLPCELPCRLKLGKSLVARRPLPAGHRLQAADICIKVSEPNGLPAEQYARVLDAELCCNIEADMPICCVKENV